MAVRNHRLSVSEIVKNGAEIFHKLRWSHGIVVCPYCGSVHIKEYDGYRYKCNSCKNRFNDKTNTLIYGSHVTYNQIREYNPYRIFISKAKQNEIDKKEKQRLKTFKWILDNTDAKEIQSHHRIYRKGDL